MQREISQVMTSQFVIKCVFDQIFLSSLITIWNIVSGISFPPIRLHSCAVQQYPDKHLWISPAAFGFIRFFVGQRVSRQDTWKCFVLPPPNPPPSPPKSSKFLHLQVASLNLGSTISKKPFQIKKAWSYLKYAAKNAGVASRVVQGGVLEFAIYLIIGRLALQASFCACPLEVSPSLVSR